MVSEGPNDTTVVLDDKDSILEKFVLRAICYAYFVPVVCHSLGLPGIGKSRRICFGDATVSDLLLNKLYGPNVCSKSQVRDGRS